MQNALRIRGVKCDNINLNKLSIEDVRRSKIVYLHHMGMHTEEMRKRFNLNDEMSLLWLKNVVKIKYPD
jgi:hypothetical protein